MLLTRFVWDLNPKREALLEALKTCPGLPGKNLSEKFDTALTIFLKEYTKRISQTQLEKFNIGRDTSPRIVSSLTALDLQEYSDEELAIFREKCLGKADQFDVTIRRRKGIARTIRL